MVNLKVIGTATKLSGIIILFIAALHLSLGTAEITNAIKIGDIRPSVTTAVKSVWISTGLLFFLSSCWIFFLVKPLKLLHRPAWWQGIFISLFYILTGCGFIFLASFQVQFAAFILAGSILLIPLLWWARAYRKIKPSN